MKLQEAYSEIMNVLKDAGIPSYESDTKIIFEYATSNKQEDLILYPDNEIGKENCSKLLAVLEDRKKRIPIQYITGIQEFYGISLCVRRGVFIPRKETEHLIDAFLKSLARRKNCDELLNVCDICTGTGVIAITLAKLVKNISVIGIDISGLAIENANQNARLHNLDNVSFVQGNLFSPVSGKEGCFDYIVSNPPYIKESDIKLLEPEISVYEPKEALNGGWEGVTFIEKIIKEGFLFLKKSGCLIIEIGHDQALLAKEFAKNYKEVCIVRDYAGLDRILVARK